MIITSQVIESLFVGFKTIFGQGFQAAPSYYKDVATIVPSGTRQETYGWLGISAPIREWIGGRVISSLSVSDYTIKNTIFEKTISIDRTAIEDDTIGVYSPMFEMMGQETKAFPDEQVFGLLGAGFSTPCYDRQSFFDVDHPVGMPGISETVSVSNMQAGAGPAWFLLDCSRPAKPLIYQERMPFIFQRKDQENDDNVFFQDEYIYGVRGRSNVGFGLWQMAFGSKATLNTENYELARIAMRSLKNDAGKTLAIRPTHLVVPSALEGDGLRLLKDFNPYGATNEWAASTKLIVSPWLD